MKCFKLTKNRMINPIYLKPQIQNHQYFDHISIIFPPFPLQKYFKNIPEIMLFICSYSTQIIKK